MRKLKMLNRISIDGYFASPNEANFGMDWFRHDPQVDQAAHEIGGSLGTLILGGATYRGFERSWTPILQNPQAPDHLKEIALELTNMDKIVFSRRMKESTWANTRFYDGNPAEIVRQTKQSASSDILILGSGSIVQQLVREELIDEFILIVTPVVAGEGKPLFSHGKPINLSLVQTRAFDSGNLIVHYVLK